MENIRFVPPNKIVQLAKGELIRELRRIRSRQNVLGKRHERRKTRQQFKFLSERNFYPPINLPTLLEKTEMSDRLKPCTRKVIE